MLKKLFPQYEVSLAEAAQFKEFVKQNEISYKDLLRLTQKIKLLQKAHVRIEPGNLVQLMRGEYLTKTAVERQKQPQRYFKLVVTSNMQ